MKQAKNSSKVVYMGPESGPFKCCRCEYFSEPSSCEKVEGEISPEGCCNLFEPEDKQPKLGSAVLIKIAIGDIEGDGDE